MINKFYDICVGLAVYNGEKTLRRTLDSLKNQTFKNLQIIICDDCSNDKSREIIEEYLETNENFKFIKNEKNIGMFANQKKVFSLSNSKYFAWVNQDDYKDISFFEKCFKKFELNPHAVLVAANTVVVDKNTNTIMHVNTIKSLDGIIEIDTRYKTLIKNFQDTIIYSLFRTEILRNTDLWININGSANKLIYELSLHGPFLNIDENLSYYYGMGLLNRYNPNQEFTRSTKQKYPFFYIPFLVLFFYQFKDILKNDISFLKKIKIIFYLINDFLIINFSKLIYRFFSLLFFGSIDNFTYKLIRMLIPYNKDVKQIVKKEDYTRFYPKHYPFRKINN